MDSKPARKPLLERLLRAWLAARRDPGETFQAFAMRLGPEALRRLVDERVTTQAAA